jgi:hypothetical protein
MSLTVKERLAAFVKLGKSMKKIAAMKNILPPDPESKDFFEVIQQAEMKNPWFTMDNIFWSLEGIAKMLEEEKLDAWLMNYDLKDTLLRPKTIAVIMAGNLPLVGFHDLLCVILSGNKFLGKLSGQDSLLPVKIADMLIRLEPKLDPFIEFTEEKISGFDAVIATGSNNTARYFEYYFGKYPHIIRKNRNSIAVLSGNETQEELAELSKDIFLYFGMGCRSVSKILIPSGYDLPSLIKVFEGWKDICNHYKYFNNYEYYKAVFLVNREDHLDNGFILLQHHNGISSPLAVLYYDYYESLSDVKDYILENHHSIQCVATGIKYLDMFYAPNVLFGETQKPGPEIYADGVDTMKFLMGLNS